MTDGTGLAPVLHRSGLLLPTILVSLLNIPHCSTAPKKLSLEAQVNNKILDGYFPGVRVKPKNSDTTILNVSLSYFLLFTVDQQQETIQFSAEYILTWQDPLLSWNTSEYNITWIKTKETAVWKPDVAIFTSIQRTDLLDKDDRYVDVRFDGTVRQSLHAVFDNICSMRVEEFPYDEQQCLIEIGPWSYYSSEVLSVAAEDFLPPSDEFKGNSEWEYIEMSTLTDNYSDKGLPFNFTVLQYNLVIRRRPQFYVSVLLVPTFVITTIALVGMFIPTNNIGDKDEKVTLGLTTLLSTAVILEIVASTMPKASTLPLLGNFILAEVFVTAIGVLFTVFNLSIHHYALLARWNPPRCLWAAVHFQPKRKKKEHQSMAVATITEKQQPVSVELYSMLGKLDSWIAEEEMDKRREAAWRRLFDKVDLVFLFVFQAVNVIVLVTIT